jgi:hypothetical protein
MNGGSLERKLDLELLRRLHRALVAERDELFVVFQDPAPEVLRAALKNRALDETHLLALLRRRDLSADLLKTIHALPQVDASRRLKVALAMNPGTPGPLVLTLLPQLYLFELLDLCTLPGTTPDQRLAAERAILQRLPATELGNKLTLARRGPPDLVAALLREGDIGVMAVCLGSSRLKEVAILQFLNGAAATGETISMIARHPRWKGRPNVRQAILKNSRTPLIWYTLFLPSLRTPDLNRLLASRRLTPPQKQAVTAELRRRGLG